MSVPAEISEGAAASPVPLRNARTLPHFPTESLPRVIAEMVDGVAEFTQTDPAMAGTCALGMLASAAGGRAEVEITSGWREPLNLFLATVAGPGERKSAVQAVMSKPLQQVEAVLAETSIAARIEAETTKAIGMKVAEAAMAAAGKSTGTDRDELTAEAIAAQAAAAAVVVLPSPRIIADDVTPEAAATLLAEQQGRLSIVSAEGGIFDIIAGRYSNNVASLDVWLKGHAGDPLRVDRKGRPPEHVKKPALTLVLMIQPAVLTAIARNESFRGRGLLARFLYCIPKSKVGSRRIGSPSVPAEVADAYDSHVTRLALSLTEWTDPAVLALDPAAYEHVVRVQGLIEPHLSPGGSMGHMADWGSKLAGATVRVAGLLHLADDPEGGWRQPIPAATVERAWKLGQFYLAHALSAFDAMRADPVVADAEYVLQTIQRRGEKKVTRRDLHKDTSRSRFPRVADLDEPLRMLEDHGYLTRQEDPPQTRPGRPSSPTYLVHPEAFVVATETTQTTKPHVGSSSVDSVVSVASPRQWGER